MRRRRASANWRRRCSSDYSVLPVVAPVPEEAQKEEEEVDEVEIERQRTNDRGPGCWTGARRECQFFEALGIVNRQAREYDDADERDDELETVVVPEQSDERRDDQTNQPHEQELPETAQLAAR